MPLPTARGPISTELIALLVDLDRSADDLIHAVAAAPAAVLVDDDVQLSLLMLYELHLRGIEGVDDRAEWDLRLLSVRNDLESAFQHELDQLVGDIDDPVDVTKQLFRIAAEDAGPPLAKHLAGDGTATQFCEIAIHRSLNQLREADVHTLGIPRLHGRPKAGLIEVQADEYGGGRLEYMHATLWANLMDGLGLDSRYAAYVDHVPAPTLAAVNTLSYFGVHRSLLNELIGHLCIVETTSALPSRDYSRGLRRLGYGPSVRLFYDEHIEADSVHEQVIIRGVAAPLGTTPAARRALIRGARTCAAVEGLAAEHIWNCWEAGVSSLRVSGDR